MQRGYRGVNFGALVARQRGGLRIGQRFCGRDQNSFRFGARLDGLALGKILFGVFDRFFQHAFDFGVTDSEIERMLEESIEYAEQDFAERQAIEARTEAEAILVATAKALANPQSASLTGDERAKIDAAVAALRESISGSDYRLIRKNIDQLNHATNHLAETMMNSAVNTVLQGKKLADF